MTTARKAAGEGQELAAPRYDAAVRREMRFTKSRWSQVGIVIFIAAVIVLPFMITSSLIQSLLATGAIYGIGAIGMNVLNGYAGQTSVGHAFFVAVGAFTAVIVGVKWHWPLPGWLIASVAVGAVFGLIIAPLAVRLRGIYQVILTLGLIYIAYYMFVNWTSVTGGENGVPASLPLSLGVFNFGAPKIGSTTYSQAQGLLVLAWLLVGLSVLVVHNVVRSRAGRAMIAMRDGDLASQLVGISPLGVMLNAWGLSSALAALCGALLVAQLQYVTITQFDLQLSLQFLVILIVGGVGTNWGPVLGAVIISALPLYITDYADSIPFVKSPTGNTGGFGILAGQLAEVIYGLLLALFVVFEPRGLIFLLRRLFGLPGKLVPKPHLMPRSPTPSHGPS